MRREKTLQKHGKKNLTPDEQKILINLLEGDTKLKVAPAKLQELSAQSRKLINEMSQDYIDMGLITKETFNRNKNIYIKRSYKGKLENRPFGEELNFFVSFVPCKQIS